MSKGRTLRVNIELTDDPAVLSCRMRFGNNFWRAKLRKDGGFTTVDLFRLGGGNGYLHDLLDEAKARGEFWVKKGLKKPWVRKEHAK